MKLTLKTIAAALLGAAMFAGIAPAMAQGVNTPAIERSQQQVDGRIQQGLRSGLITPSEARNLLRRTQDIQDRENRFKSDGRATPAERQILRRDLDVLHTEVERKVSNGRVAGPGPGAGTSGAGAPGIDARQFDVRERIALGVRSGRISKREARELERRDSAIVRMESRFKADGVITQQERRQLRNELSVLRADVERAANRRGG